MTHGRRNRRLSAIGRSGSSRRRRAIWVRVAAALGIVALLGGLVAAEYATRGSVNDDLADKAARISVTHGQAGTVEGAFTPSVEHVSVLAQRLSGTIDRIVFTGQSQSLAGAPFASTITVHGQPADLVRPADRIDVQVTVSPQALQGWAEHIVLDYPDAVTDVRFGDGTIHVSSAWGASGFHDEYTLRPQVRDGWFEFTVDWTTVIDGTPHPHNSPTTVAVGPCDNLDGATAQATAASVTPEGLTYSWTVTGEGATLDNLSDIVSCV